MEGSQLDVPMDHFNKSSDKTFSISIIRMLAKNASTAGDRHILLNPGGPGGMLKPQLGGIYSSRRQRSELPSGRSLESD